MPSKLIVLPTELTINKAGLSNGNGKRGIGKRGIGKRVACSDDDSASEECAATGDGATASRARDDDVASEAYPDSDADQDVVMTHSAAKQPTPKAQARKKVRSEGGSSSSGSGVTTASGRSTSSSVKLATITVTSETRKPTAWEVYKRKQEAKQSGR